MPSCHSTRQVAHRAIPPLHYMVAGAGSYGIPLAGYATFGTRELSEANLRALAGSRACLLANHGLVAAGTTVAHAMKVLQEVESLCQIYLQRSPSMRAPLTADCCTRKRTTSKGSSRQWWLLAAALAP